MRESASFFFPRVQAQLVSVLREEALVARLGFFPPVVTQVDFFFGDVGERDDARAGFFEERGGESRVAVEQEEGVEDGDEVDEERREGSVAHLFSERFDAGVVFRWTTAERENAAASVVAPVILKHRPLVESVSLAVSP